MPRTGTIKKVAEGKLKFTRLQVSTRSEQVIEQLTQAILSGELSNASTLPPERDLALQLGVSRSVVREAVKTLQAHGLLTVRHGVGTVVNSSSSEPVQRAFSHALHGQEDALLQLTEMRLAVEVDIAALAAQRATVEDLARLRLVLEEMDDSVNDPERFIGLDEKFHLTLAAATQNRVFGVVLEAASTLARAARVYSLAKGTTIAESIGWHRAIADAVAAGDGTLAADIMEKHLRHLLKLL